MIQLTQQQIREVIKIKSLARIYIENREIPCFIDHKERSQGRSPFRERSEPLLHSCHVEIKFSGRMFSDPG